MTKLNGLRCLIVDDEPDLREILGDQFMLEGCETVVAENGKIAFEKFTQEKFDFILSDVRMPQGNGVELLEKVRAHEKGKTIPFFLVTGFADYSLDEIFDRGANGVFPKPFDFEALLTGVRRSLLPDSERLKRSEERVNADLLIEATFGDRGASSSGEILNLSRGGFFCCIPKPFPRVGQMIDFKFQIKEVGSSKISYVEGVGICRWVRERVDPSKEGSTSGENAKNAKDLSPGFGIEFLQLTEESRQNIKEHLEKQQNQSGTSFIPKE
jgi:CheY-like chemotaxis protein